MAQFPKHFHSCFSGLFLLLCFTFILQNGNVEGIKIKTPKLKVPDSLKWNKNSVKENEIQNEDKVTFHLYSNNEDVNDTTQLFLNDVDTLSESPFIPHAPLKILIHGFISSGQSPYVLNTKNAYLNEDNGSIDRNILIVNWKELAAFSNPVFALAAYTNVATRNVPMVGKKVAKMISFLVENNVTTLDLVHVIGHSLGAHVSGEAGRRIQEKYGQSLPRITGLDPAGPLFYTHALARPLTSKDAQLVDIIHTDSFALGKAGKIGQADFYPNGGFLIQPGCLGNHTLGLVQEILTLGTCSHSQSQVLFKNSIGTTDLRGCKCFNYIMFKSGQCPCQDGDEDLGILGENIEKGTDGKFYLDVEPWMEK